MAAVAGFLCLAGLVCGAGGCASKGPEATTDVGALLGRQEQNEQEIKALNERLFAAVSQAPQYEDYTLGPGDLLEVTVFEAEELNSEVRVSSRGYVTLPLLGTVEVKGLSSRQAEERIEGLYRQRYLRDPHVGVFVREQMSGRITLLGAVEKPGTYDYPARQRPLDVLALAGGLGEKAGRMAQVTRRNEEGERTETFLVDLDELIKEGKGELNLEIEGGDVVFVPEAGIVYVDGAVRKPGSYPIQEGMTVQEAIVAAGGFGSTADEGSIKLVRHVGEGKREVVELSFKDPRKSPQELKVEDRDVVFVETNRLEALIYGLRLNLGMGLVGIGYTPPPQ